MNYLEYRSKIKELIAQGKATGPNQSESLLKFSILNDKRMDRLDKKLQLKNTTANVIKGIKRKNTLLVIAEGWCGDAAQVLPVINKIAEFSTTLSLNIVLRDEHPELMDLFLTNGNRAIPKVIILDENNELINTWGPRPSTAAKMVEDYKARVGVVDATLKKDLQLWYNHDKGENTQQDLLTLLKAS